MTIIAFSSVEDYRRYQYIVREDLGETELFPAVRTNDIQKIARYLTTPGSDVNAVDSLGRTALQSALQQCTLTVDSCSILIRQGIDLNHKVRGSSALDYLVHFYKFVAPVPVKIIAWDQELFRSMVEGGADLDGTHNWRGIDLEPMSTRATISAHPELEMIVQEVNSKRANEIFSVLPQELHLTRLICQMLDCDPGASWKPSPLKQQRRCCAQITEIGTTMMRGAFRIARIGICRITQNLVHSKNL